jgi:hypothetical protein
VHQLNHLCKPHSAHRVSCVTVSNQWGDGIRSENSTLIAEAHTRVAHEADPSKACGSARPTVLNIKLRKIPDLHRAVREACDQIKFATHGFNVAAQS